MRNILFRSILNNFIGFGCQKYFYENWFPSFDLNDFVHHGQLGIFFNIYNMLLIKIAILAQSTQK